MTSAFRHTIACFFIVVFSFAACQKIVHVNLKEAAPQLVIDADMSNLGGLKVVLSKSVAFYADNDFPTVDNAIVLLQNLTTQRVDAVPFQGDGTYILLKKPAVGTSYQLTVIVDSATYTAVSTMPEVTLMDSVSFSKRNSFGKDIISAKVNFQDKAGVENYYLFRQYILKNNKWSFFSFSDRLSDGRYIQYNLLSDSAYIAPGDSVLVDMQCIDKNVYKYFSVLEDIAADQNGFGSASPANPPTNIVGNALGIFNVHSDNRKKVRVPDVTPIE
ncbi:MULTISPECIES: DUF4249 family protein [Chitinophagaceae]